MSLSVKKGEIEGESKNWFIEMVEYVKECQKCSYQREFVEKVTLYWKTRWKL